VFGELGRLVHLLVQAYHGSDVVVIEVLHIVLRGCTRIKGGLISMFLDL
jgi:hypothetical protein